MGLRKNEIPLLSIAVISICSGLVIALSMQVGVLLSHASISRCSFDGWGGYSDWYWRMVAVELFGKHGKNRWKDTRMDTKE